MFDYSTDGEWERFGATDPYFGVVTHEKYRRANLTEAHLDDFFRSGEDHVAHVLSVVRDRIAPGFRPQRCLDFGCGVGRLAIPLARVAGEVVGVDVSPSMLREAVRNCAERQVTNARFVRADDDLAAVEGQFDLVHSFIVFQHIPVRRGERIVRRLLDRLAPSGVGVLHFVYAKATLGRKLVGWVKGYVPMGGRLLNVAAGRSLRAPALQMNAYDVGRLLFVLQREGVRDVFVEFTDHGGELGVLLFFRRPDAEPGAAA